MSGKGPHVSPLESRKRLLIAESELNRAQLLQEWESVTADVHGLAERARSFSFLTSSAASLVAGLWNCRGGTSRPPGARSPWIDTVLRGVRLAASIGLTFRSSGDKEESK